MRSKTDPLVNTSSIKYKNLIEFVKELSIPERQKIIDKIQIDTYFNDLDEYKVITNGE